MKNFADLILWRGDYYLPVFSLSAQSSTLMRHVPVIIVLPLLSVVAVLLQPFLGHCISVPSKCPPRANLPNSGQQAVRQPVSASTCCSSAGISARDSAVSDATGAKVVLIPAPNAVATNSSN